ncbi:MAG: FAD/NAD-binding family oxidoreductase [Desulfomonilia bacterium]|jgi:predicted ferric reductase
MGENAARIARKIHENSEITSLFIEGFSEQFRSRRAGQFLTLKIMQDGQWSKPHPFTISCAPEDPLLRVTIKKAGAFTSLVPTLKEGDPVIVSGPYGKFCQDIDTLPEIIFIAGGVGITPFLSVLRHFRSIRSQNRVVLLWSNKSMDDAFAVDELAGMTREIPLKVVHCLSREEPGSDLSAHVRAEYPEVYFDSGRLSSDVIRKYLPPADPAVFLCGPPPMQDYILGEVEALGMNPGAVLKESFTWQGVK